jgi:hypothetical protein
MLHLEGSGTPVLYIGRNVLKGQLMTYIATIALCSEIRTKHSTQSEQPLEFLNVKPGGT